MFRLGILVLIVAAIFLAVTNPNEQQHRQAVFGQWTRGAGLGESIGGAAGDLLGRLDGVPLDYHNYVFFSTVTFAGETRSIGLATHVWPVSDGELPQSASDAMTLPGR